MSAGTPDWHVVWALVRRALLNGLAGYPACSPGSPTRTTSANLYRSITVERPLRDATGKAIAGEKGARRGKPQPDSALRDTEKVPLAEAVETCFKPEVPPHAPDVRIDPDKTGP